MTKLSTRKELLGTFKEYLVTGGESFTTLGDVQGASEEESILTEKETGLPVLVGLKDGVQPYIVDLEDNTSTLIVGSSGSGKSWFLNSLLLNLFTTNDYEDLNVYLFDLKNTPQNKEFAKYPHVKNYVTDIEEYEKVLEGVENLRKSRQQLLNDLGEECVRDYRESLLEKKEYEKLKEVPEILVIVDEYTAMKAGLENNEEEQVTRLLDELSQKGRSAGIRLVILGQSVNEKNLSRPLYYNSSVKIGFKNLNKQDLDELYGKEVKEPEEVGEFLITSEGEQEIQTVTSLTVGGSNNSEQLEVIKSIGTEWDKRRDERESKR